MQSSSKIASFAIALMLLAIANSSAQLVYPDENVCRSPNGISGTCISIKNCPKLLQMLQQQPLSQSSLQFLQQSQCGFDGNHPEVCCEGRSGGNTDGNTGGNTGGGNTNGEQAPPDVSNHRNLRLLDHDRCGPINDDRIIGGNKTGIAEFPWMALIAYRTGEPTPQFRCGGSIINNRYVLTAAHCVTGLPSNFILAGVRIGEHDLSSERDCQVNDSFESICNERYQDFGIERATHHPQYSRTLLQNDVAVIRLDRAIDFRPRNARPICMPIGPAAQIRSSKMVVAGWGITESRLPSEVMLKVKLPRFPQDECVKVYKTQKANIWYKQLCMGGERGQDSCQGDSGGPLMAPTVYRGNSRYVQYGIVSFGTKICGLGGYPGVYTRVDYYLDWILDQLKG